MALTTYSQPVEPMADKAVEFVTRVNDPREERHEVIPGELIVRGGTRRA